MVKAEDIVPEINELSDYINSTDSCSGSKFEAIRKRLVSYMGNAILIMRG